MSINAPAIKIQYRSVPFLTQAATVSAAQVRGYIASIEGYLWGKADGVSVGYRQRTAALKENGVLRAWLDANDTNITAYVPINVAGHNALLQLQQLDRIALDIKETAGSEYLCTPETANVPRQLTRTNAATRLLLDGVIALFNENSCDPGQATIQTVAHLPPPQATYRIDRENVSALPAPQYWTYRLQNGGAVNGGIVMETGITFNLADVQLAFTNSNRSVALAAAGQQAIVLGFYVQLRAPAWLRGIAAA